MVDPSRLHRPASVNDGAWPDLVTLPLEPLKIKVGGETIVIPRYYETGEDEPYYQWLAWMEPEFRPYAYRAFGMGFKYDVVYQFAMRDGPTPDINNPEHLREDF